MAQHGSYADRWPPYTERVAKIEGANQPIFGGDRARKGPPVEVKGDFTPESVPFADKVSRAKGARGEAPGWQLGGDGAWHPTGEV